MSVKTLLNPKVRDLLIKSIESELYASNLYKHIANHFQRMGMFGGSAYFLKESAEELEHYKKIADYMNDMGDVADIPAIPKIKDKIESVLDALEISYEAEYSLMQQYQKFYEEAEALGDCITSTFLIEYMQIQRKSVGQISDLIARYSLNKQDLLEFDEYLKNLA